MESLRGVEPFGVSVHSAVGYRLDCCGNYRERVAIVLLLGGSVENQTIKTPLRPSHGNTFKTTVNTTEDQITEDYHQNPTITAASQVRGY